MKWKFLELQGKFTGNNKNMCGFKLLKCTPPVNEMKNSENELL